MSWCQLKLGDVMRVKHGFAFKSQFFVDQGKYILLTPGSCHEKGGLKLRGEKEKFYDGPIPEDYLLKRGDLLIIMTDLVNTAPLLGGALVVPEDDKFLHNQRLGLVEIIAPERIDRSFLYYILNDHRYREQVRGSASGSTVRHTAPERILKAEVSVPFSLLEQEKIAKILKAYDDLIENNQRRIQLLEESAHQLYREWFVHLRFPGHEHLEVLDGVPQGWSRQALEAICIPKDGIQTGPFGSQLHQSDYADDGIPVVMPKDIASRRVSLQSIARIPESLANQLGRHRMQIGDTVYGRRGDIGRRAFIGPRQDGYFCGTGCLRFRPDPTIVNPRYLFDQLGAPDTEGCIINRAKGSTMPNLSAGALKTVPILLPPKRIQESYAEAVEPTNSLIETLAEQNQKLAQARDLLLPRLMNGEITV